MGEDVADGGIVATKYGEVIVGTCEIVGIVETATSIESNGDSTPSVAQDEVKSTNSTYSNTMLLNFI